MADKLQKMLAHAGHGSRREIETWISDGRISLNGKRAKLGDRAEASDRILLDGKLVYLSTRENEPIKALIYHKPEGEICTRKDPKGRTTIYENLPDIPNGRWVSVGRLDINTSGLILLTNSGELANKLMHPSTGVEREYLVRVRGAASPETIEKLTRGGVDIDGTLARFESVVSADMAEEGTNHWYRVVIKEGRYREVRRMWDAVNHTVSRLKRIRYGTIKLARNIKRGQHAKIAPKQLEKLAMSVDIYNEFEGQLYSSRGAAPAGGQAANQARKNSRTRHANKPDGQRNKLSGQRNKPSGQRGQSDGSRNKADGSRNKAEGIRGKAEGSRNKADGSRGKAEGSRNKARPARRR